MDRQESTAQDVSEEFVDLQSEITNLKVTEEGLQKLIDKAEKLEDILSLQKELTGVRGEIQKRQGRLNFLDNRTAFSTITINLSLKPLPEVPATATPVPVTVAAPPAEAWQPEKTVNQSWDLSHKILGKIGTVVLQVLVFSWWYLPFLTIGIIVWWVKRAKPRDQKF